MKSIHYYIQYHCNANLKYGRFQGKRSRVSYNSLYRKLDVKIRKSRWCSVFKENVGYPLNDSQYWLGNT